MLLMLGIYFMTANAFTVECLSPSTMEVMKEKKVWKEECLIPLNRLRIVKFNYYNFEYKMQDRGQIVVLDAVADHVLAIFKELFQLKFPLSKACPIEFYNGSDDASMADNNSSCFNCREIAEGGNMSIHSYGLAIDINPVQNPCVIPQNNEQGLVKILPSQGLRYLNRTNLRPGMIESSTVREVFKKHGFTVWGGQWNHPIDWHHFQPPRAVAQLLAVMAPNDANTLFDMYTQEGKLLDFINAQDNKLISFYRKDPLKFMEILKEYPELFKMLPKEAYSFLENKIK